MPTAADWSPDCTGRGISAASARLCRSHAAELCSTGQEATAASPHASAVLQQGGRGWRATLPSLRLTLRMEAPSHSGVCLSARALSAFRIPEQWCWSQARFGWGAGTKFLRNTRTLSAPQMGRDRFALSGFRLPSFHRHHGRESQALSGFRFPTTHLRQDVENDTTCHRFPLSSFRRPSSRGVEKMEEHFRFPPSADPPRGAQRNGGARRFAFRRPLFSDHFPAERCETVV